MESATHPQLLELHRSVSDVTSHMVLLAKMRNGGWSGACGQQKLARINNPGLGNAPGYQWVDESQAGWWRVMQ